MCPVCLATMGLYVAGGVSAGGITTYLADKLLRRDAINTPKKGDKSHDEAHDRDT